MVLIELLNPVTGTSPYNHLHNFWLESLISELLQGSGPLAIGRELKVASVRNKAPACKILMNEDHNILDAVCLLNYASYAGLSHHSDNSSVQENHRVSSTIVSSLFELSVKWLHNLFEPCQRDGTNHNNRNH